jgi:hypothetical protein
VRPSIGSLLQELSIGDEWDDLESFFEFLATNVSKLSVLRLGTLHQVKRHLPELLYLRELHIDHIEQEWIVDPRERSLEFLQSFRRNGSLELFSLGSATYTRSDDSDMRLVDSFCLRNRETLSLLTKPSLDEHAMVLSDDVAAHLPLFPSLISAARHAKQTAANVMLAGMLSTYDAIGTSGSF